MIFSCRPRQRRARGAARFPERADPRRTADKVLAVLHFIRDQQDPAGIVEALRHAMPSAGSYLVISHGTQDFNPARAMAAVAGYEEATAPFVLRSRGYVERFFDGLDMVAPGVVQLPFWRPDGDIEGDPSKIWLYADVAGLWSFSLYEIEGCDGGVADGGHDLGRCSRAEPLGVLAQTDCSCEQ